VTKHEITREYSLLEEVSKLLTLLSMLYIFPRGRGTLYKSAGVKKSYMPIFRVETQRILY